MSSSGNRGKRFQCPLGLIHVGAMRYLIYTSCELMLNWSRFDQHNLTPSDKPITCLACLYAWQGP